MTWVKHHIRHLKRHRNILYGFVSILVVVQIITFMTLSSQLAQVHASSLELRRTVQNSMEDLRQENYYQISEISREVTKQRVDLQTQQADFNQQISVLRATNSDFSQVIEEVIKGVVSVGTDKSAGTGFIVHAGGYIVTNAHVVQDAQFVRILAYDSSLYEATVIKSDPTADLALLKINGLFSPLDFASSDSVVIGEKVIAIGNPLGLSFTVTEGIVSAVDREGPNGLRSYIQTDVTLNPGNSGGPLIDSEGNVIGVNNFKIGNAEGLGFALDGEVVSSFIADTIPSS